MEPVTQDQLLSKTSSKYKLVTLMQKRAAELMRGLPPLVEGNAGELWPTIVQEILTDKIQLMTGEDAEKLRREIAARETDEVPAMDKKDNVAGATGEAAEKAGKDKDKKDKKEA